MIRSKRTRRNRAGYTLIHQVIFLAIMPMVFVAATTWVHESLKMSSRFKHRRESHVAMNHLASQIQDEVRGCKSLKFNSDLNQIELSGHNDQQITFKIDDGDIHKTLTVDGEVAGRESFRLSDEYFVEWDQDVTKKDSNHVALNIFRYSTAYRQAAPDSLDVPDPKLELVITARANRWKRSVSFGRQNETEAAK